MPLILYPVENKIHIVRRNKTCICNLVSYVPQGRALGPQLFVLHTTDLGDVLENNLFQKADESTLIVAILFSVSGTHVTQFICLFDIEKLIIGVRVG